MKACVICGMPHDQHEPCAVCDVNYRNGATVAHWKLCEHCAADRVNAEWSREETSKVGAVDDVAGDERRAPGLPLAEVAGRTRRRGARAVKKRLIARLLMMREVRVEVHYVDRRGHWRGYYWRTEYLSRRAIARRVGCSHTYVNRVFRESVIESIARQSRRRK